MVIERQVGRICVLPDGQHNFFQVVEVFLGDIDFFHVGATHEPEEAHDLPALLGFVHLVHQPFVERAVASLIDSVRPLYGEYNISDG